MKITFEGHTIREIVFSIRETLTELAPLLETKSVPAAPKDNVPEAIAPVDKPVDEPVEKPAKVRTAKQLENDERLRETAKMKAAKKASVREGAREMAKLRKEEPTRPVAEAPEPEAATPADPTDLVKIRQKTIEDLQSAYANGFQKEVFELLATHGNGAKSFRELPPEAFLPIREAIDAGALAS